MTIKEVAQLTGLSHQAIYKKIKAKGLKLEELKDKATGQFTPEGEAAIRGLFNISGTEETPVATEVEKLTTEVERLRNLVEKQGEQIKALTDERDFLRLTLERSQHLEAAALAKLPSPPPALPAGEKHGLRNWLQRIRGHRDNGDQRE